MPPEYDDRESLVVGGLRFVVSGGYWATSPTKPSTVASSNRQATLTDTEREKGKRFDRCPVSVSPEK